MDSIEHQDRQSSENRSPNAAVVSLALRTTRLALPAIAMLLRCSGYCFFDAGRDVSSARHVLSPRPREGSVLVMTPDAQMSYCVAGRRFVHRHVDPLARAPSTCPGSPNPRDCRGTAEQSYLISVGSVGLPPSTAAITPHFAEAHLALRRPVLMAKRRGSRPFTGSRDCSDFAVFRHRGHPRQTHTSLSNNTAVAGDESGVRNAAETGGTEGRHRPTGSNIQPARAPFRQTEEATP
ncbi:hypothetical protein B0T25DRAFT_531311 [Lasiosphaeria hispida]|uniref:Uncharacterized protein n=1 Tax=Lasiosphaeria hispida TaxID=260671 RepID=A0AAJ0MH31_9PEZI|nr:hypothetical protein B0T25DRAFT_531311 [Lasiosphaeria hispida]